MRWTNIMCNVHYEALVNASWWIFVWICALDFAIHWVYRGWIIGRSNTYEPVLEINVSDKVHKPQLQATNMY